MLNRLKALAAFAFALLAAATLIFLVFWPAIFFQGNASGVGEVLWLAVVAAMVLVIAMCVRSDQARGEKRKSESGIPDSTYLSAYEDEELAFHNKVKASLSDARISGYINRGLVDVDQVTNAILTGPAFRQALKKKSYRDYAANRDELDVVFEATSEAIDNGAFNFGPVAGMVGTPLLIALLFTEIGSTGALTSSLSFIPLLLEACFAIVLVHLIGDENSRLFRAFLLIGVAVAWASSVILPATLAHINWPSILTLISIILFALACTFSVGRVWQQFISIFAYIWRRAIIAIVLNSEAQESRDKWLDDCVEDIIMPQVVLAINTALGEDKDRLLVEHDSEGLRRLQDPSFTVSTMSEHRITSVLSQIDGGSIAVSGPRGAGKSTLLKIFSEPSLKDISKEHCIPVYLTAPAEYIPKDFIAELFQRLCEAYLVYVESPLPGKIYKERRPFALRRAISRVSNIIWLCLRAIIAVILIVWMLHYFAHVHFTGFYPSLTNEASGWYGRSRNGYVKIHNAVKPHWIWTAGEIALLAIIVLALLPGPSRWIRYIKPRKEPMLASKAREYLLRLQIDKTATWGSVIGSSALRGYGFSVNRGGSARYVPWTLPELVGHVRRFMQEISVQFAESRHAIIVGIDEIDRIGSLDHAEKFIGEIKAIFGVRKCFFLVAVAEDVGSVFAQRATAGRSILENAFDDIVAVEPLSFGEARDLLLKRVPGFTDSFVYLAHALSGGLPRELIRVTRRLVEVNGDLRTGGRHARLENLAIAIVEEELIEAVRATRNQMSRLTLHGQWTPFFEKLRSASITLRYAPPFLESEAYDCVKGLSELLAPEADDITTASTLAARDEEEAKRIASDFAAFAYFGLTIIDAFSDQSFDLQLVQRVTGSVKVSAYEELSVARAELGISAENARAMIGRLRNFLVATRR